MINIHPTIPYFVLAGMIPLIRRPARKILVLLTPVLSLGCLMGCLSVPASEGFIQIAGLQFVTFRADPLSLLFVYAFLVFSFLANLYGLHVKSKTVLIAGNLYAASALGAVLAGDIIVLFIFWEIMALTSAALVWNRRNPSSLGAVFRYLLVHAAGGILFFAGVIIKMSRHDSIAFDALALDTAGWLIFTAFLINAAVTPLHAWLPDAYPSGTPAGSVYLSAFTTKVAVYAFARGFAGQEMLIYLGAFAAVYGVIYALMENDIRRLLSYHIVCQIGYMIAGIGLGTGLGINAGTGHAVGNILFKGLLFMATGAVLHMTWRSRLTDLGGLAKRMPWVVFYFMAGALAISGAPFLNGYLTKGMLSAAAQYAHLEWLSLTLTFVAAGTFLSIACKLGYFAFWHVPKSPQRRIVILPLNCHLAMAGTALLCLGIGLFPGAFFRLLPFSAPYEPYDLAHITESLQLLAGTLLAFLIIRKHLHLKNTLTLDLDWFYRIGAALFLNGICLPLRYTQERIQQAWTGWIANISQSLEKRFSPRNLMPVGHPLLWITAASLFAALVILIVK